MKKVFLLLFLAFLLVDFIHAQTLANDFEGGDGTKENPYQIANIEQLRYLAYESNNGVNFEDKYFIIVNDIKDNDNILDSQGFLIPESDELRIWTPIGENTSHPFMGNIDGENHILSGFYGSFEDSGIFKNISNCVIENIIIKDSYFQSLVASELKLKDVTFRNCINHATTKYGISYGSQPNSDSNVNFINCGNFGKCEKTGIAYMASSLINCYNFGEVGGEEVSRPSSLVYECASLINCFNAGRMYTTNTHSPSGGLVWGLINQNNGSACINNCINYGEMYTPPSYYYDILIYGIFYKNTNNIHDETYINHIYWLNDISAEGFGELHEPYTMKDARPVSFEEMTSDNFLHDLNSNAMLIENACGWVRGSNGFPVLEIVPEEFTGGVDDLIIDSYDSKPVLYFTLDGIQIQNPSHGVFFKIQGSKREKIIL